MKRFTVGLRSILLLTLSLTGATPAEQAKESDFIFACFLPTNKQADQVVFAGRMNARQFHRWFKEDYGVEEERLPISNFATQFGFLFFSDGKDRLVVPLYAWETSEGKYFACQSRENGKAPRFRVWEHSQKAFLEKLKMELNKLSGAEPSVSGNVNSSPNP